MAWDGLLPNSSPVALTGQIYFDDVKSQWFIEHIDQSVGTIPTPGNNQFVQVVMQETDLSAVYRVPVVRIVDASLAAQGFVQVDGGPINLPAFQRLPGLFYFTAVSIPQYRHFRVYPGAYYSQLKLP